MNPGILLVELGTCGLDHRHNRTLDNTTLLSLHHQTWQSKPGSPLLCSLPSILNTPYPHLQTPTPATYHPSSSHPQQTIETTHMHLHPIQKKLLTANSDGPAPVTHPSAPLVATIAFTVNDRLPLTKRRHPGQRSCKHPTLQLPTYNQST